MLSISVCVITNSQLPLRGLIDNNCEPTQAVKAHVSDGLKTDETERGERVNDAINFPSPMKEGHMARTSTFTRF